MSLTETFKKVAYRTPGLSHIFAPRYPYKINPGQLSFLCEAITSSREAGGCILEIGVAKGDTSVFLLEHMRTTGEARTIHFLDTFNGFTSDSINYEVTKRGKDKTAYDGFRYGDEAVFAKNLRRLGYGNFKTVAADASKLDYGQFGPISVVLLDVDLYLPTQEILERVWPCMTSPGFICVHDRNNDTAWDGSHQAYLEFAREVGFDPKYVGGNGGVIIKSGRTTDV